MATDASFAEFVVDQAGPGLRATVKRMFGEYALYVDGKVLGFLCDNRVYLKPTEAGRALLPTPEVGQAYPGSKDYWIADSLLEERDEFQALLRATASELPFPKPKKAKAPKASKVTPLASEAKRAKP